MATPTVDVAIEAHADLGEAPLWDDRNSTLVFVDILRGEPHSYAPAADDHQVRQLGAVGLMGASRYVGAMQDDFTVINVDGEARLAPFLADRPSHRMNDTRVDPVGRFWGGCMANDLTPTPTLEVLCDVRPRVMSQRFLAVSHSRMVSIGVPTAHGST